MMNYNYLENMTADIRAYIDDEIDFELLERCANQMLRRHKVLCTALTMRHGEFYMQYIPDCCIGIRRIQQDEDLTIEEFAKIVNMC